MGMMNQHALKQRGGMWSNVHEHKKKFPLKKLAFNTLYVHLHSSGISKQHRVTNLGACSYLDFFVQNFLIILNSCHLSFQVLEMIMGMATELHRMGVSLMSRVVKVTVVQICV